MNLTTNIEGFFKAQFQASMSRKEIACKTPIVSELIGAWDVSINGLSLVRNVTILLASTIDGLLLRGGVGSLLLQVPAKIAQFAVNFFLNITKKPETTFHLTDKSKLYKFADDWEQGRAVKRQAIVDSLEPVEDDCYNIGLGLFRLIPGTELYYKAKYDCHALRNSLNTSDTLTEHFKPNVEEEEVEKFETKENPEANPKKHTEV